MFEEMLEERSFNLPPIFSFKIEKKRKKKISIPKVRKLKTTSSFTIFLKEYLKKFYETRKLHKRINTLIYR